MPAEPQIAARAPQAYAGLPMTVTMSSFASAIDAGFPELFGTLAGQGVEPAGPPIIVYHVIDMEGDMEVELGVPGRIMVPGGHHQVIASTSRRPAWTAGSVVASSLAWPGDSAA